MTNIATCQTGGLLRALEDGSEEFLAPLLGPDYRHERAGVIRPGIMRLRKYPENQQKLFEQDSRLFAELVAEGLTWDEIEKRLGKLIIMRDGEQKEADKLAPMNVDYFTINKGDCVNPVNADKIRELYADSDGKVRSFPVWFTTNDWWNLIPHSLRCYGFSGLKHKSSIHPDQRRGKMVGYEMVCESPSPVEPGRRIFGGRDWVRKPCIPEDCTDFQTKQCTFGGSIQCMIPGLKGMGAWIVPTTSWYSIKAVKNTLNLVWKATGGRIAHLLYEGETIFVLRKVRGKVSAIDKEGNASLKEQYLISLDVTVDPLEPAKGIFLLRNQGKRGIGPRGDHGCVFTGNDGCTRAGAHRGRIGKKNRAERRTAVTETKRKRPRRKNKRTQGGGRTQKKRPRQRGNKLPAHHRRTAKAPSRHSVRQSGNRRGASPTSPRIASTRGSWRSHPPGRRRRLSVSSTGATTPPSSRLPRRRSI